MITVLANKLRSKCNWNHLSLTIHIFVSEFFVGFCEEIDLGECEKFALR